ncbi:MAG: hypothetical protein HRT54_09175 [Colwellia sp.]|nr:hypothetical protein [Colwellia sp.]
MELINNCRYQGYDQLFNDEYIPCSMLQSFLYIVTSIFLIDSHLRTLEQLSLIEHPIFRELERNSLYMRFNELIASTNCHLSAIAFKNIKRLSVAVLSH